MIISFVVAATSNNVIGKDNRLLWHLPNDMKFFKGTTWAMPVVMGRKTFDSLGKPLQGRLNIVITRNNKWLAEGATIVHSVKEAINTAAAADYKEIFVIGGGEIFKETLPIANKIYLTRVNVSLEGDAFFPHIDPLQWKLVTEAKFDADLKHAYPYSFQLWERL